MTPEKGTWATVGPLRSRRAGHSFSQGIEEGSESPDSIQGLRVLR